MDTSQSIIRRPKTVNAVARRALGAVAILTISAAVLSTAAGASSLTPTQTAESCETSGCIDVVAIDGLIDEIQATNIIDTLRAANRSGNVDAIVFQIDSEGSVVSNERLTEVATAIAGSRVPASIWIGPSGAVAYGGSAELVSVAAESGIAPGSSFGKVGEQRLPTAEFGDLYPPPQDVALQESLDSESAVELALVDREAPIVREHVLNADGVEIEMVEVDGVERPSPLQIVRFYKLPLGTSLMHTVASPSVAYLLVAIAIGLLLFEFYTAGVGVAGVVGAGALVLGGYGVAALPHNTWALVMLGLSALAFAVDIQSAVPRVWTGVGLGAFGVGSLFLFTDFRPSWIALVVGIAGMSIAMVSGMPSMVRARFGTPTIGRDWMIGEMGEAVANVDPDGLVRIRGALWRARTNRVTPIAAGEPVRVVEIDGPLVEVEPEEGGAKDYREFRNSDADGDTDEDESASVRSAGGESTPNDGA